MCNIVHNPVKASNQVLASDCTAGPNLPMMGSDSWQVKQLGIIAVIKIWFLKPITAYFTNFLVTHRPLYILLIRENKKRRARQPLGERESREWEDVTVDLHLQEGGYEAPPCNPEFACDPLSLQPRRWHLFARNSFANMVEEFSGHQHPLLAW